MINFDIYVESAGITDIGSKRKTNQDSLFYSNSLGLYIVADGMGGHQGGDIASRLVIETMKESFDETFPKTNQEIKWPYDSCLSDQANKLVSSIHSANAKIFQKAEEPELKGMGSTVSAVCFTGETIIVANVGDSPIYLLREDKIETLSIPHSLESQIEDSELTFKRAKHILTRAVGVKESVQIDSCEIQCFKKDTLVICSDGLSNMVDEQEIKEIVDSQAPEKACRTLVDLANERGGNDNITIIVVKINTIRHSRKKKD